MNPSVMMDSFFKDFFEFFNFRSNYKLTIRLISVLIKIILMVIFRFVKYSHGRYFGNHRFIISS